MLVLAGIPLVLAASAESSLMSFRLPWTTPLFDPLVAVYEVKVVATSFGCGILCFVPLFWSVLHGGGGSRLLSSMWTRLPLSKQQAAATAIIGVVHSLIVAPLATIALWQMLSRTDGRASLDCNTIIGGNLGTARMPTSGLVAVGVACAFFVQDCLVLARYAGECRAEQGDRRVLLMWLQHAVSLVVWPYCALTARGCIFVAFFLFTEWSKVLENAYGLAPAGQFVSRTALVSLGAAWVIGFFINRILPAPWVLYAYYRQLLLPSCGFSIIGRWTGILTVPVPIVLNAWWFVRMVKEAATSLGDAKGATQASSVGSSVAPSTASAATTGSKADHFMVGSTSMATSKQAPRRPGAPGRPAPSLL